MATKKIIYSANLQDFRPVIWYGLPVHERYTQLNNILTEGLGEEYAAFISEPLIKNNQAHWLSGYITNGKEFTKLNPDKQELIRVKLQNMLNRIKGFASELKTAQDPHQQELGELLELATEVPSLDNVIVDGERIVLVAWGFSSEKSFKENFKLEAKVQKPIEPAVGLTPDSAKPEERKQQYAPSSQTTESNSSSSETQQAEPPQHTDTPTPPPHTPADPPKPDDKPQRKGLPGWLWFILGALLMLIIFLILRSCENNNTNGTANQDDRNHENNHDATPITEILPEEPGVIPPMDTTKIIVDPEDPGQRKVFSDQVNIAVAKGVNMEDFARSLHSAFKDNLRITYYDTAINLLQVQTHEGEFRQWIDTLKHFTNVKLAFPNTIFENAKTPAQDPDFKNQKKSWYFSEVEAYSAWDITEGDTSVIVAICDNGFDISHKELSGKIVSPYNVTTQEHTVGVCRGEGREHGTHVAGTAIGNSDNNQGLCGIAPKCKFMPIQIADNQGNMSSITILSGILYAIHHNANVVNLSVGNYYGNDVTSLPVSEQKELIDNYYKDETIFWNDVFQFALDENVVLVLAAGNQNIMAGIDPFARTNKALIVSAYQKDRRPKAEFSNFGQYTNISAPGVEIYSSVPGGKFDFLQGTSMSSPIVTGAVALIKSKFPDLKAEDIISIIRQTAKPLNSSPEIGPLLQIAKALKYAGDGMLLNIPEDAKDLSFAEGKWKSTTELVSTEDETIGVELFFDISKNGTGTITYVESNGYKYTAPLEVTFEDGKLIMKQNSEATGSNAGKTYSECVHTCQQSNGSSNAECLSKWETEDQATDFRMIKIN